MADQTPSTQVSTTPATATVPETPQAPPITPTPSPSSGVLSSDPDTQKAAPSLDPKVAEQTPTEPTKPQGELFEIDLDGEKKSLSANELVDYTQEKIETAINIHDRYMEGLKGFAENPLKASLDAMAEIRFGGDKRAAYQELIKVCDQLLSEEHKYRQLPESERKAIEAEDRARAAEAALRSRTESESLAQEKARRAEIANTLIAQMATAIKESGLDDSREIRKRVADQMQEDNRRGLPLDAKRAAARVKAALDDFDRSREEAILKRLDIATLQKSRPEIVKAAQELALEDVRRAREEAEKKAQGEPASPTRPPVGRILPSNRFATAEWP